MQLLLPEKLSRNGTGATSPAQATDKGISVLAVVRCTRLCHSPQRRFSL